MFKEWFDDWNMLNRFSNDRLYFSVVANNGKEPYFIISRNCNLKYNVKTRISLVRPKFIHKKHNNLNLSKKEIKYIINKLKNTNYYRVLCKDYTSCNGVDINKYINIDKYRKLLK